MVIDTSKLSAGSWKTTVAGWLSGGLLFLQSYLSNGHALNWHDPALLVGLGLAILGTAAKDSNVTGGTVLQTGAVPDARLHAEAVADKTETPAEASPAPKV